MGYVTNRNQQKIIAKASSKSIFRWIVAYSCFAFDNVFLNKKNVGKIKKNVKKRRKT